MLERKKVPITGQNENAKWEKVKVGKASISSLKNSGKRAMTVKFKQVSKAAGYEGSLFNE